jgi:hypothetical protein
MEDNALLAVTGLAVIALIYFLNISTVLKIVNFSILIFYTGWIFISWSFTKDPSSALAYWFYLLFLNILHIIILFVQYIFSKVRSNN